MKLQNMPTGNGKVVFALSVVANLAVVLAMLYVCLHFNADLYPFHPLTFPFVLVVEGFAVAGIVTRLREKRKG